MCIAHNFNFTVKNALNLWKAPCENDDEEIENCDDEVLEDDDYFDEGKSLSDDESDLEDQEEFSDFDINYSSSAVEIFLGIPKLLKNIRNTGCFFYFQQLFLLIKSLYKIAMLQAIYNFKGNLSEIFLNINIIFYSSIHAC